MIEIYITRSKARRVEITRIKCLCSIHKHVHEIFCVFDSIVFDAFINMVDVIAARHLLCPISDEFQVGTRVEAFDKIFGYIFLCSRPFMVGYRTASKVCVSVDIDG